MATPERFSILIEGNIRDVRRRWMTDHGQALRHLLNELLLGTDIPDDIWSDYGLRVTVEEDTDQGPD